MTNPSEPTGQQPHNSGPSTIDFQRMHIESLEEERAQLLSEVERLSKMNKELEILGWDYCDKISAQAEEIKRMKEVTEAFIKTLQISLPNVAAPLRETFELAIAKAKDKLHGNGKA